MDTYGALTAHNAVEGAFIFGGCNIAATVSAGPQGSPRAGENGVAVGRFAWVDVAGVARNFRNAASDIIGLVLPQLGPGVDWRRVFFDETTQTWRIRQGLNLTLLASGNMRAHFKYGAYIAQPVYANVLDGSLISGYSEGAELTRWKVTAACQPESVATISTWS